MQERVGEVEEVRPPGVEPQARQGVDQERHRDRAEPEREHPAVFDCGAGACGPARRSLHAGRLARTGELRGRGPAIAGVGLVAGYTRPDDHDLLGARRGRPRTSTGGVRPGKPAGRAAPCRVVDPDGDRRRRRRQGPADGLPGRRGHRDPAPGNDPLVGGRPALPRVELLGTGRARPSVPVPAVRAPVDRAVDRPAPLAGRRRFGRPRSRARRSGRVGAWRSRGAGRRSSCSGHRSSRRSSVGTSRSRCSRRSWR